MPSETPQVGWILKLDHERMQGLVQRSELAMYDKNDLSIIL